jgi:hypothetical protein
MTTKMMTTTMVKPQSASQGQGRRNFFIQFTICAFLFAGFLLPVAAQQITGSIAGTVKDEQSALIAAAAVKATNVETGFSRSAATGGDGAYLIQYLPVGRYTVEVVAPNFKKFVQQNLVLTVDQTQMLNVTLVIGIQSQTITVSEAPPLVDTNTAELGRTVQPVEIIGLPLVNRNVYTEISLTPGVQSNSASASNNTPNFVFGVPSTQVVVNGGIDGGVPMVAYYLDGGINMTGLRNYGNPLPNPDAIQEFRVETSDFSAQYGRMSGAVVTAVTKSGTNVLHGSLFEFNRNTDLNAFPWNAPKDPSGNFINAPYHRNQFGGAVGGPVRRDKAFFFFSYAGLRQTLGSLLSGGIVPTTLERLGDFTQSKVIPNMPGTSTPVNGTNSSSNCTVAKTGCIPSSLFDKTAQNILGKYIPNANTSNLVSGVSVLNGYTGYFTGPTNQDEYLGKYDQSISDKDHVSVSYFYLNTLQNAFGGGSFPYMINQSYGKQQDVNLSDIHTISPITANQAWITFTRVAGGRANVPQVGIEDLGSSFTTQGPKTLPDISVSGYFSAGGSLAGPISDTDYYSVRDVISTMKGKHALDYGGEMSLERDMAIGNLDNFGIFSFTTSGPTTTKNALADFLTGQVASMEQDTPYTSRTANWYYAFFLQDNYRIFPRLALNMGLRYDISTPPTESQNRTSTFVPGVQSTVVPSAPLGMLYPGDKGVPRGIVDLRMHHVSPRVGIVWDPFGDGKTAVRAGAGVFYGSVSGNEWNQPSAAQPFAVRQTFSSITSLTNVYGNPASFPNGDPFPYTYNPKSPRFLPAASVETIAQNYQWPLTYQINAAIERQLPGQVSVTTAYVSSLSHDLPFAVDANNPAYAAGASTSQASINARRPYDPGVLGQVIYIGSNQTSSYHSLQISARRPLTHNLMLNGFYVLSKSFWSSAASGISISTAQDYNAMWEERGPSDVDRRHMASISGVWNVDYYRGSNFILKEVANGWSISSIITLNSGTPFSISTGTDKNFDSYSNDRPNLVSGTNAFLDPHRSRDVSRNAWFNTLAFTPNGPGLGIGPGGADGNTPRDYLRAPGYRDVDLGIFRDISFEGGIKLQVRGEATNAFNLVSLNGPTASLASSSDGHITSAASPRLIQIGLRLTF